MIPAMREMAFSYINASHIEIDGRHILKMPTVSGL